MNNLVNIMKDELIEQKETTENLLEIWDKFLNSDKYHYNIPLPQEIIRKHDNEIGFGDYCIISELETYKEELKYYKKVAEYYDENDFIINDEHMTEKLNNPQAIEKYYISPQIRRRVHEICNELEKGIQELEKL